MTHAYRADVDGLRAVAVISVLLFHVGWTGARGGYVGVDVFFVISGYLITGLLRKEIARREFSFGRFYLRRVRRLAPALLVVLVSTTALAWLRLYPEDMSSFGTSLSLQPLALQNFFFLADGEYFRGAEEKPLLHTWSLAVEEQFYLVWPLLLLLLARRKAATSAAILAMLFATSFGLGLALTVVSPKASFFLLPPRAWELELGALIALLEEKGVLAGLSGRARHALGAAGVAAMGVATCLFSPRTVFPGYAAMLPVAGAAAFLAAGAGGSHFFGRLFAHRAFVHIGLLSYPLYLWHWPVMVFWRYGHPDRTGLLSGVAIIALSTFLAELTYRFVEGPVRGRRLLPDPSRLVATIGVSALALVAAGVHLRTTEGAAYRFSGTARGLLTAPFHAQTQRCGLMFRALHPFAQVCPLQEGSGGRGVLIWGDSHADMWSGLFRSLAAEHGGSVYLNARNCRPTIDNSFCGKPVQDAVLEFARSSTVTDVALIALWYGRYGIADNVFEAGLSDVVSKLSKSGKRVWLVVDTPGGTALDPLEALQKNPTEPRFGNVPAAAELLRRTRERAFFEHLAKVFPNVGILDPSAALCDEQSCWGGRESVAWYRDASHLTDAGADKARSLLTPIFTASTAEQVRP